MVNVRIESNCITSRQQRHAKLNIIYRILCVSADLLAEEIAVRARRASAFGAM